MSNFTLTNTVMTAPMVSGIGQFHTNEADPKKPTKTLTPYVTVTWPEIITMAENPPEVDKSQGQWFIPSTLLSRTHDEQKERGQYYVLPFDFDKNSLPLISVVHAVLDVVGGCDYVAYNSRSATVMRSKCRVLIPLAIGVGYQEYRAMLHVLNDALDAAGFITDRALERAGQVVYLPNRGEVYQHMIANEGSLYEPSAGMAERVAQYIAEVNKVARDNAQRRADAMAKRANITWNKYDRPIDAFNASYTVEEILDRAGYDNDGRTNYRHPESESGGFSASVKNGRVYSLSPNDRLYTADTSNGAHDAFSAFCVLFHGGDQSAALIDAGDNLLMVNGESWNKVSRREHMQKKDQSQAIESFDDLGEGKAPKKPGEGIESAEKLCTFGAERANKTLGRLGLENLLALKTTDDMMAKVDKSKFAFKKLIVQGHIVALVSKANGGKTTIMTYAAAEMVGAGYQVMYINVDAGASDLKVYHQHAQDNGYTLIAPDMVEGGSPKTVLDILEDLAIGGTSLSNLTLIFDTLKKFTDVMTKSKSKAFYALLRKLTALGATCVLLAHTNKYEGEDGKPIYEGTGDLRNDIDELIYLIPVKNPDGSMTVSTLVDKARAATVDTTFNITADREVTESGTYINTQAQVQADKQHSDDSDAISFIEENIVPISKTLTELHEMSKNRKAGFSRKRLEAVLKRYCDADGAYHLWDRAPTLTSGYTYFPKKTAEFDDLV